MVKLSAALIIRNEANNLDRSLGSLKGVDELVIVDTGSEDNSVEVAKKYTDKVYTDYKWNDDFAEARNHAKSKCTGDWIITIDADCELKTSIENAKKECEKADKDGVKAVNIQCIHQDGGAEHYIPYLYKNDPDVLWHGKAHNHLSADVGRNTGNVALVYWYSDSHYKDPDRTLRILKKVVLENTNLVREKFYLAREYLYRRDYITALYWYQQYLPVSQFGSEEAEAHLQMAKCYWNLGRGDMARGECMSAIGINTNFKEAIEFMAEMSGPKNRDRWLWFAQTASNDSVLFIRTKTEQGKKYYDELFKESSDMSRYQAIQEEIGLMVRGKKVLDIGCGTGELAKYINNSQKNYKGFDFSDEAIKIADNKNTWVGNAYDKDNYKGEYDYYIATEVLEHLDDFKVIENIPNKSNVIFTVPSFQDPSHIRVFTEQILRERYKDFFNIDSIIRFNWQGKWVKGGVNTASYILLVAGTRK